VLHRLPETAPDPLLIFRPEPTNPPEPPGAIVADSAQIGEEAESEKPFYILGCIVLGETHQYLVTGAQCLVSLGTLVARQRCRPAR
jgi:hypothetical protein